MKDKFPYLVILAQIAKITAWISFAFGFLVFFIILVGNLNVGFLGVKIETGGSFFISFLYLAYGLLALLVFSGISELILLLVSIEENLRRR